MEILSFLMGILYFYFPSFLILFWFPLAVFLGASIRLCGWFLAALLWSFFHEWQIQDAGISSLDSLKNIVIEGTIVSVPVVTPHKTSFRFEIDHVNHQKAHLRAILSCYQTCPKFSASERWKLMATLKKPVNFKNPGSFDYRGKLFSEHIHWVGYVQPKKMGEKIREKSSNDLLKLREWVSKKEAEDIANVRSLGIMKALSLGMGEGISLQDWDLFRRTGTVHLMVISGAHIGLSAGLGYFLFSWIWLRVSRLCLWLPEVKAGGIGGVLMALGYALLSGFGIPAKRALMSSLFLMLRPFHGRYFLPWQAFRYALFVVLLIEPHAVQMPGFYLSFGAVLTLMATSFRFKVRGFQQTIVLQLACFIALTPLTLYWFSQGSVSGLIANFFAIPLVGFIIVPSLLFYIFLLPLIHLKWLVWIADWAIRFLLKLLEWVDGFSYLNFNQHWDGLSVSAFLISIIVFIWLPNRFLIVPSVLLFVSSFFPKFVVPPLGETWIHFLDVGQGLSVVVRTASHVLIFDTGMAFYGGSDMGKLVVLPYLSTVGVKKVDEIVISHGDLDHRGGLNSIWNKYPDSKVFFGETMPFKKAANCHLKVPWIWDGVHFMFLPLHEVNGKKNNTSCVLKVSTTGGSVLLTGDIEAPAENYLLHQYEEKLHADILLVAHHGSKTSSTDSFLSKVSPRFAVISSGEGNRYHFPHAVVVERFRARHISIFNTALSGLISFQIGNKEVKGPFCGASQNKSC